MLLAQPIDLFIHVNNFLGVLPSLQILAYSQLGVADFIIQQLAGFCLPLHGQFFSQS